MKCPLCFTKDCVAVDESCRKLVLPQAEAMAAAAAAVQRACSAETQDERGAVRISASELVSCEILPAILAEFCLAYSHIELELTASNRNEDLLGRSVDI